MDEGTPYLSGLGVSVAVLVANGLFFWNRCPVCKARAMRETGQSQKDFWEYEWECKCGNCGHVKWMWRRRWGRG